MFMRKAKHFWNIFIFLFLITTFYRACRLNFCTISLNILNGTKKGGGLVLKFLFILAFKFDISFNQNLDLNFSSDIHFSKIKFVVCHSKLASLFQIIYDSAKPVYILRGNVKKYFNTLRVAHICRIFSKGKNKNWELKTKMKMQTNCGHMSSVITNKFSTNLNYIFPYLQAFNVFIIIFTKLLCI